MARVLVVERDDARGKQELARVDARSAQRSDLRDGPICRIRVGNVDAPDVAARIRRVDPVSEILPDTGVPDISSKDKRIENYKLQYAALRERLRSFTDTRFIVWTGAALTEGSTSPDRARRAADFFKWVRDVWDEPGDNIFTWDFFDLETEGSPYMKDEHAAGPYDSHPSPAFSRQVAPLFCQRIVDVIEGRGDVVRVPQAPPEDVSYHLGS